MKGFVRFLFSPVSTRQGTGVSLSRLLALLFGLAGILTGLLHPDATGTVVALVSGGSVAILSRERGQPPSA